MILIEQMLLILNYRVTSLDDLIVEADQGPSLKILICLFDSYDVAVPSVTGQVECL